MSPEQATGAPVDKRTDVWAFGVVLFEMLTGQRLFEGQTTSHTLADVIRAEIDFNRLPATTPPDVRAVLERCLDREPRRRLRDIREARLVIDRLLERSGPQHSGAHAAAMAPPPPAPARALGLGQLGAGAAAGVLARGGRGVAVVAAARAGSATPGRSAVVHPGAQRRSRAPPSMSPPAGRTSRLSPAARANASCGSGNSTSWTAPSSRFATTTASPTTRSSRPTASGLVLSPPPRCARCRRLAARP